MLILNINNLSQPWSTFDKTIPHGCDYITKLQPVAVLSTTV